jgi:hypothetical protein
MRRENMMGRQDMMGRGEMMGRREMGGDGGRRGQYAEAEGDWEVRYELSPTVERYSEMPAVEVFRGHEMDAKGASWTVDDSRH